MCEWRTVSPSLDVDLSAGACSGCDTAAKLNEQAPKSTRENLTRAVGPCNSSPFHTVESQNAGNSPTHSERRWMDNIFIYFTGYTQWTRRPPLRFIINCVMLTILLLLVTLYTSPEYFASEEQRKTVLYHFLGDNYIAKGKGDIVLRPTVYLHTNKNVLNGIKDFVNVYYALSNASVSELNYFYYAHTEKGGGALTSEVLHGEVSEHLRALHAMIHGSTTDGDDDGKVLHTNLIKPVHMSVELYLYSPQERRGPAPVRRFTYELTDENPLGPFADDGVDYDDNAVNKHCNNRDDYNVSTRHGGLKEQKMTSSVNNEAYLNAVCAPRYDDITGYYYNPCRSSPKANDDSATISSDKNGITDQDDTSNNCFMFPLLDNARRIRLRASVRHMIDATSNSQDQNIGFSTVIYHWTIEKYLLFHPGGLVETTFDVSVEAKFIGPRLHMRFCFIITLLVLGVVDLVLRFFALKRIVVFRRNVVKAQERVEEDTLRCMNMNDLVSSSITQVDFSVRKAPDGLGRSTEAFARTVGEECATSSLQRSSSGTITSDVPLQTPRTPFQRISRFVLDGRNSNWTRNACSLNPETTYTDFNEAWRERLQGSRGEGWHHVSMFADILVFVYGTMALLPIGGMVKTELYSVVENIILGLAGLFLSVGLQSYFRLFPNMYFAVRATRNVIPRLLFFAMSVAPLFIGFAFFFWIVFGPHSNGEFTNMGFSLIALYFVMYGDAILPAIQTAETSVHLFVAVLANLMTVIYVFLFMMTMLNLAMAIAQEEWVLLRRRFGACLSVSNMLFAVRSREQVKTEAMETVIANLELLLHIRHEEELRLQAIGELASTDSVSGDRNGGGPSAGGNSQNNGGVGGTNECYSSNNNDSIIITGGVSSRNDNNNRQMNSTRDGASFAVQQHGITELYRCRLDELTEGILNDGA